MEQPLIRTPFNPTPVSVVRAMLGLAGASVNDIVYDLGCGDGRVLLVAVEEYRVKKAVGIEDDPEYVKKSKLRIEEQIATMDK